MTGPLKWARLSSDGLYIFICFPRMKLAGVGNLDVSSSYLGTERNPASSLCESQLRK